MNNNKQERRKKTSCSMDDTGSTQEVNLIFPSSFSQNFNFPNSSLASNTSKQLHDNDQQLTDKRVNRGSRKLIEWSEEQNIALFDKFVEVGSKWVELSQHIPTKSDNAIKNRFYCCLRKVQKRINKVQKQKKIMIKRMISFDSLLTILQIGKFGSNSDDRRFDQITLNSHKIIEVRDQIVALAKRPQQLLEDEQIQSLILRCLDFKHSLKFLNIDRVKKSAKKKNSVVKTEAPLSTYSQKQEFPIVWQWGVPVQQIKMEKEEDDEAHMFDVEGLKSYLFNEPTCLLEPSLLKSCSDVLNSNFKRDPFDDQYFM